MKFFHHSLLLFIGYHGNVTSLLNFVRQNGEVCPVIWKYISSKITVILFCRTPCVEGRCQGFNEKKNVFNAARHFTTFLLPHGAPFNLRPDIDDIVVAYSNATLPAGQLLRMLDAVVDRYRNGDYLYRRPEDKNASEFPISSCTS